jgi:hypothetical protein
MATQIEKALSSAEKHKTAFNELNVALGQSVIRPWEKLYLDYYSGTAEVNIFQETDDGAYISLQLLYCTHFPPESTIAFFKLNIARDDAQVAISPDAQTDITPMAFIVTGLELEEQRHKLLSVISSRKSTTAVSKIADWQSKLNSLSHRISQWRKVQLLHMPGIPLICSTEADLPEDIDGPSSVLNLTVLHVKLLLPSEIDPSDRLKCCPQTLVQTEIRLRFAMAEDALRDLRKYLAVKKTLVNYKIKHVSGPGQRANTHARAIIDRFKSKIDMCADKYRTARHALELLDRDGSQTSELFNVNWTQRYNPLTNKDMVFLNQDPEEDEEDESSQAARGNTRKRKQREEQLGEGHRTPGWIWRMPSWNPDQNATNAGNDPFNATVRVEWAKTKARAERWQEEVLLLKEEMRRAIVDMEWRAQQWMDRAHARPNVSPDLLQGLTAYAYKQADIQISLAAGYAKKWVPILKSNGFDYSFAAQYVATDIHDPKGKRKADAQQEMYVDMESDWETDDEHLY